MTKRMRIKDLFTKERIVRTLLLYVWPNPKPSIGFRYDIKLEKKCKINAKSCEGNVLFMNF